jgi:hypothetical protein
MQQQQTRLSRNNRHDTLSDVSMFLEREHPQHARTVEVVCSSARRDMDRQSKHTPFRLYVETPALFTPDTPVNTWPESTAYACWHCCHAFDTVPIPVPKKKRPGETDALSRYTVYGIFCSCNCAVAYILERNTYDQQLLLMLFKEMMIRVFGMSSSDVFALEPAPPRIFLTMFGGHLEIDEFRSKSLVARTTLLTPPFISYSMILEENTRSSVAGASDRERGSSSSVPAPTSVAPITSHTVRGLRRPTTMLASSTGPDDGDVPMSGTSAFDKFVKIKSDEEARVAAAAQSDRDEGGASAPNATVKRPAKRAARAPKAPVATTTPVSVGVGAGTLAAFLT